MTVPIAAKRHFVRFRRNAETGRNAFGQPVYQWTTVRTAWAEFRDLAGRELANAQEVHEETTSRLVIRGPGPAITADDQAIVGNRALRIAGIVDPEGRGIELWIDCSEWKDDPDEPDPDA